MTLPPEAPQRTRPSFRLGAILALLVLAGGVTGYFFTGVPDYRAAAERSQSEEAAAAAALQQMPEAQQLQAMAAQIEEHLKARPDDSEGWIMLGRARAMQGNAEAAVAAYARAVSLGAGDAKLLADYAEVLGAKNGRTLRGEPTELLQRALALEPGQPKALALAGAAAFDREDWAAAIRHWERLVAVSAADAGYVGQVKEGIDQARQRLAAGGRRDAAAAPTAVAASTAPPTAPPAAGQAAAAAGQVSGSVQLAPALASRAAPDDTVFIVARAAQGPRMPLAILRKQVRDLPISFTLDDSMAMSPAMRLSAFPQVIVSARVSRSGQAQPQPGDLLGETGALPVGSQGLRLSIDKVVGTP